MSIADSADPKAAAAPVVDASHCVFIHTNPKQMLGAKVAAYALQRNSPHAERFAIHIISTDDHPFVHEPDGELYLRDGARRVWLADDLQSFTPLRFLPPELMGYQGRALIMDPDIFAIGDVWELLNRDMGQHAILCRSRSGPKGFVDKCMASSVMLLACDQLTHWRAREQFAAMFSFELDYHDWICLKTEERTRIGPLESEWNDFDHLGANTKLLHTTRRKTQPWKTGLPVDWRPAERFRLFPPLGWLMKARRRLFGEYAFLGSYRAHPDPNQELLFFGLLRECLERDLVTVDELRQEMANNHVRHDALAVLDRVAPLPPPPAFPVRLSA